MTERTAKQRVIAANPRTTVVGNCSLCGSYGEGVRTGHAVTKDLAHEGLPGIGQLCVRCWCGYLLSKEAKS